MRSFDDALFFNEINRFIGSGGEVLIKGSANTSTPRTLMQVGDRLIGIGITHMVERFTQPPGLESFNVFKYTAADPGAVKMALRAFEVSTKTQNQNGGFDFTFKPLTSADYSDALEHVSNARKAILTAPGSAAVYLNTLNDSNPGG